MNKYFQHLAPNSFSSMSRKLLKVFRHYRMTSDELEVSDSSPRIRKMFCSLGEVSRSDGSAVLSQGGTTVVCGVYGPAEVRTRQTGDVVDR